MVVVMYDGLKSPPLALIFGEIEEEKRLVKVMSKTRTGEQTAVVPLDGCPDEKKGNYFCGWLRWENTLAADVQWGTLL